MEGATFSAICQKGALVSQITDPYKRRCFHVNRPEIYENLVNVIKSRIFRNCMARII